MTFIELFNALENKGVRYLLVGGIAVNLHGIVRATNDIDLIVFLEQENLNKFIKLVTSMGYLPKIPVKAEDLIDPQKREDWAKNKNMIVFCFYHQANPMNVIDVFIEHPLPFEEIYSRRKLVDLGKIKVPIISIPDLITLKKQAGRLQDESDIQALQEILKIEKQNGKNPS